MFNIGTGELIILALIAIVLFGKEDLPATLRKFSKGWGQFKKVSNDAQRSWMEVRDDMAKSMREVTEQLEKDMPVNTEGELTQYPNEALPQINPPEGNTEPRDHSDHHHQERIAESSEVVTHSEELPVPKPADRNPST